LEPVHLCEGFASCTFLLKEPNAMSRFKIDRPHTIAGESARALLARMHNCDLESEVGEVDAYRLEPSCIEALFRILGKTSAESALRSAGFVPMQGGFWITRFRTASGGKNVARLFPPYDLLHAIVSTHGRDDQRLSQTV